MHLALVVRSYYFGNVGIRFQHALCAVTGGFDVLSTVHQICRIVPTIMAQAGKPKKVRAGYRQHLAKRIKDAEIIVDPLLQGDAIDLSTQALLDGSVKILREKLNDIKILDKEIMELSPEDKIIEEIDEIELHTPEYGRRISSIESLLEKGIHPPTQTQSDDQTSVSSAQVSHQVFGQNSNRYKLKRLNLITFTGDQLLWIGFHEDFTAAVHDDNSLPGVTKFRYLLECLDGPPKLAISGLPITAASYEIAIKILQHRYGDTEKNVEAFMHAIFELPSPSASADHLLEFHDKLQMYVRALKTLGEDEDNLGKMLLPVIRQKLPGVIRSQLKRVRGTNKWSFEQFRTALYNEIDAIRDGVENPPIKLSPINNTHPISSPQATAAFHTFSQPNRVSRSRSNSRSSSPGQSPRRCTFCKNSQHLSKDCDIVKDHRARLQIVKNGNLCFSCLDGSHARVECGSKFTCNVCNSRDHNTAIHYGFGNSSSQSASAKSLNNAPRGRSTDRTADRAGSYSNSPNRNYRPRAASPSPQQQKSPSSPHRYASATTTGVHVIDTSHPPSE